MATKDYGSLTKEFPLSSVDKTIEAITPGMRYSDLLRYAKKETESSVPGLIRKRFLSVDDPDRIIYDEFLALIKREGISSQVARKVMLFTWAYRAGSVCLSSFSGLISGMPAGFRPPRSATAG